LNSRQAPALAAVLTSTIAREDTPRQYRCGTLAFTVAAGIPRGKTMSYEFDVIYDHDTGCKTERGWPL